MFKVRDRVTFEITFDIHDMETDAVQYDGRVIDPYDFLEDIMYELQDRPWQAHICHVGYPNGNVKCYVDGYEIGKEDVV